MIKFIVIKLTFLVKNFNSFSCFRRLLEQVRSSIEASLRNDSTYQAALYDFAFEYRHKWSQRGYRCRLTDTLLFNRIKSRYSGQLKVIFTGGAPLRKATAVFIKHYLNTKLLNVYASTESIAMSMGAYDQFDDEFTVSFGFKVIGFSRALESSP